MITLPPFKAFLASNIPSVYDNTLSYYEELTKLIAYLEQEVVPAVNETSAGLKELKEYVEHYFDNLDVQEEINNKLDEMAESGELATIIAQFLEMAPVFAFDTISDLAAATNLIAGCAARVVGNTSAMTGDGAYYKIRAIAPGDIADGFEKVAITADNTIIAVRVPDAGLDAAEAEIQATADAQFNQVKLYENLIYNATSNLSFQGSCVDENGIMYQYVSHEYDTPASQNGELYKFNINNHTYVGVLSNVPFYHGNSLAYDNGSIWAAATLHDNNPSNKIVKYNVSDGTSEEFSPFSSSFVVRTSALTTYGDKLMVCGSLSGNALSGMKFALVDKATMLYDTYTLQNPKHFNLDNNVLAGLTYADGKLYVLTESDDLLFELIPDDTNLTLTVNKIYEMPDQNDLRLEVGEYQGITALPEAYYGKKSFIVATFMSSGAGKPSAIYVHNMNLASDLAPTVQPLDNQYYSFKGVYIHVSKTAANLVEDGTSDRPFKSLVRAIEYANAIKAAGRTVAEIYIDDNDSYDIGNMFNLEFVINSNDYVPSIYIGNLVHCDATIKANSNIKLYKTTGASNIYLNNQSKLYLENATVYDNMYLVRGSGLYSNNLTVAYSGQDWMTLSAGSEARLNILAAASVTRNVVSNRNSSFLLINTDMTSKVYTDNNAYTVIGTA